MINKNKKVIERILARKNGVKDDSKIGLIFEGGGMKGQFSSGAAVAIHKLGLTGCFDYIYGSSSGSCAAAYLTSGNIEKASPIYYEYLSGLRFIKPWKISKLIDIDFLCDDVFRGQVPLDLKKMRSAKPIMKVYVADAETAKGYCFTNKDNIDYYELLKASCAIPGYYDRPVKVGNVVALDGNAAKKLPIEEAFTDGCTDILVITTSQENQREKLGNWFWLGGKFLMRNLDHRFIENYKKKVAAYNETLDIIFGKKQLHKKVNIYTISPDYPLSPAEIRVNKLKKIEQMGINKIMEAFKGAE